MTTIKRMTHLECMIMGTYHHFEVLSKGDGLKPNIFHAMDNMGNHSVLEEEESEYESWGQKFSPKSNLGLKKVIDPNLTDQERKIHPKWF